jgi:hypothetical protein
LTTGHFETFFFYNFSSHIERNEMGGACSAVGEGRGVYRVCWGNLMERDHWGDPGLDGRIVLRWILRKWDVGVWTGLSWFRIGIGGEQL